MANIVTAVIGRIATLLGLEGDNFRAISVDDQGRIRVVVEDIATGEVRIYGWTGTALVSLKSATSGELAVGTYVWEGTGWVRCSGGATGVADINAAQILRHADAVPFHYKDRFYQSYRLQATAGAFSINGDAVPAGEVWVVSAMDGTNENSIQLWNYLGIVCGGTFIIADSLQNCPVWGYHSWSGNMIMKAGDNARIQVNGCVAGDWVRFHVVGYKMYAS